MSTTPMQSNQAAAPELAQIEFEPMSRGELIAKGAIAAAAIYGVSAAGSFARSAFAQGGGGDVDILNYALTLEYLESAFYAMALEQADLDKDVSKAAETISKDEDAHVKALSGTIKDMGAKPVKAPGVDFGDAFASQDSFLQTAITFEDLGVSAYNGAAPMIKSKELLGVGGSIVQVEGRHAGVIRFLAGEPPAPEAFDQALDMDAVLKAATPFIKA